MAFSPQEIDMLFSGAMQSYIFKFAFESRNPGCEFDIDSWIKDLNQFGSNDLMIMSPEKQQKVQEILNDLDKYAKKKGSIDLI